MASNTNLEPESQGGKAGHSEDRREGGFANNDEAKAPPVDNASSDVLQDISRKGKERKSEKKVSKKPKEKGKEVKSSWSIKATTSSSNGPSDDSEDDTTDSSSDESSEAGSESTTNEGNKKKVQKRRQELRKAKKSSKSSKPTKKQVKPKKKASKSSNDKDTDDEGGACLVEKRDIGACNCSVTLEDFLQLQVQIRQLSLQLQACTSNSFVNSTPMANTSPTKLVNQNSIGLGIQGGLNTTGCLFPSGAPMMGIQNAKFSNPYSQIRNEQLDTSKTTNYMSKGRSNKTILTSPGKLLNPTDSSQDDTTAKNIASKSKKTSGGKPGVKCLEFKRVDQIWDSQIHNYKLQDTADSTDHSQYDEYLFHVRRTFDWEGKYKTTVVDIKSKQLREALRDIIGNVKGISLVEETPKIDPKMLFLYLPDMHKQYYVLKELEPEGDSRKARKKVQKGIDEKRRHLKALIKYIETDFAETKKSLDPLLQNGLITFDLLWALWKPNTLAYSTMYGSVDEPRVFKVEVAEKHYSIMRGEFYYVEGKYFEYDGKQFGYGSTSEELNEFRGARRITSLSCYPLKFHKSEVQLRGSLIERGKKFVSLSGVHYKSHQGMAYYKKKKSIVKVNIDGRVMVDPAIHRRINPNYPVSLVRPKDHDILSDFEDNDLDDATCGGCESENDVGSVIDNSLRGVAGNDNDKSRFVTKIYRDKKGNVCTIRVHDDPGTELLQERLEKLDRLPNKSGEGIDENSKNNESDDKVPPTFTDEEYLIASPVVLGFAFAEKLWLEFTVSGIKEISWNEHAYDSLVLESKSKDIVKALVESHKYHPAASIDDVIQGKGKGLVAVLHGPPGTGKTLTAEGISELLKCPLYMVSAGDLGTDSRYLEAELQKILDICHAWSAILLLDEADVFLEKRNMQDIHRNALVSIFLRQLEYFQGILFLTTNRVQTFDDAFQSRIHIALRYDDLDMKAKKAIFKIFMERARVAAGVDSVPFTEEEYTSLAKHNLNGRQIKNTVGTAQALAVNKGEPLSMRHIREVLNVQRNFEQDLKGGNGYQEAMRSYF
ncbi:hypothetical protein F5Y11DRAFT_285538 [Daldinia sp. FL1419]|nr:hypothetical protein F5Y11DRAFT_285538 [Daldinia sp. FL1419]